MRNARNIFPRPFVLGLTGGIGMGKSTAARQFRALGIPVHDADAAVHQLLRLGGAAARPVAETFPDAVVNGAIDRTDLGKRVFANPAELKRLEAILHPLVHMAEARFLHRVRALRKPLAVLDIPLLYETGGQIRCHAVAVVNAPRFIQRQRVLRRPGFTPEKLNAILARQWTQTARLRHADFIIPTGGGKRASLAAINALLHRIGRIKH